MESSSLSPPASAGHCSSSSPSLSSSAFSTVHMNSEEWRAAHHRPPLFPPPATALPLPLLLRLLRSPLLIWTVESNSPPVSAVSTASHCFSSFPSPSPSPSPSSSAFSTVHGRTGSGPNLNVLDWVWPSKIKKIKNNFLNIVFYLKN